MKLLGSGRVDSGAVQLVNIELDEPIKLEHGGIENTYAIATSDSNNTLQLWSGDGKQQWAVAGNPQNKVTALSFTSSEEIISASEDGSVSIWVDGKIRTQEELAQRSCEFIRNSRIDRDSDAAKTIDLTAFDEAKRFCDRQPPIPLAAIDQNWQEYNWRETFRKQTQVIAKGEHQSK